MICAISGEVPQHPVVSLKTGHIFEKRLIEKYIADKGTCPITGESLSGNDLLIVQITNPVIKPRGPTATSVPSLLMTLQNEWDSLMLETHSLKLQLEQARQELSHTLYQHDAACRVIARLVKEKDAVYDASIHGKNHHDVDMAAPSAEQIVGLSASLAEAMTVQSTDLSKERRKRKIPDETASAEEISQFTLITSQTGLHSASTSGITCISTQDDCILTGGMDKHVVLYNRANERILHTLKGHTKRVSDVILSDDACYSSSYDKTVRVWQAPRDSEEHRVAHILRHHTAEVTSLAMHPLGTLLVSAGLDGRWVLNDIVTGTALLDVVVPGSHELHSLKVHPDGILLATGSADTTVRMWDVKSQKNVASFTEDLNGAIGSLSFSENGYYLATSDATNVVKIWDLRKLTVAKSVTLPTKYRVNQITFDASGQYLAIAGSDLRILNVKQENILWTIPKEEIEHTKEIYKVAFTKYAKEIIIGSHDRQLRIYGSRE